VATEICRFNSCRLRSIRCSPTRPISSRIVAPSDLAALHTFNSDPEVTKYLPYAAWTTDADATAWLERTQKRFAAREAAQFAIRVRETEQTIGNALLFNFSDAQELAEIGYVIGRAHWGHGYVVETMRPIVDYAFDTVGCHRLQAKLDPRNRASARVLEKLGFTFEGTAREDFVKDGLRADTAYYGLLRRERKPAR
jgi:[ribosomal protein S5]-alanine N-acetyltransferase